MSADKALKEQIVAQLHSAKKHLQYSYDKVVKVSLDQDLSEEQLESFESFSSRFARYSDLMVAKYFRNLAVENDPAFRGSVIDLLNTAEKFGWIESAKVWRRIRELRNVAAHDYQVTDFKKLYKEIVSLTPSLLKVSLDL